jgi:hypothetical protein
MYKVVVKAPDYCTDLIREIAGYDLPGMPLSAEPDADCEQLEFLCRDELLNSLVNQIKDLDPDDDISLEIYPLNTLHD